MMKRRCIVLFLLLSCIVIASCSHGEQNYSFQGSYQVFEENGRLGLRNAMGDTVIPAEYIGISPIVNNLCIVYTGYTGNDEVMAGLWNTKGEHLLQDVYSYIFLAGTRCIVYDPDGKTLLYDAACRTLLSCDDMTLYRTQYSGIDSHCFIASRWNEEECIDQYGILLPSGEIAVDIEMDDISGSSDYEDLFLMIDWEGHCRYFNLWAEPNDPINTKQYWFGLSFCDGYAMVSMPVGQENEEGYFMIDRRGEQVTPVFDRIALTYGNGAIAFQKENAWLIGFITEDGFIVSPESYTCAEMPYYIGNGVFVFQTDHGVEAIQSDSGMRVQLSEVSRIGDFVNDTAVLYGNRGVWGYLHSDMSTVMLDRNSFPIAPDQATAYVGEYSFVKYEDTWCPVNREGKMETGIRYQEEVRKSENAEYFIVGNGFELSLVLDGQLNLITQTIWVDDGITIDISWPYG